MSTPSSTVSRRAKRVEPAEPIANPGYDGTIAILREAGYHCRRQFRATDGLEPGMIPVEDLFELYVGPKGVVIVQKWAGGHGAHCYVNWGIGHTFEELKAAL